MKSNLVTLSSPKRNSTSNPFKKTKSYKEIRDFEKERRNSRVRFDEREDLCEGYDEAIVAKSHNLSTIASEYEALAQENASLKKSNTRLKDELLSTTGSLSYAIEEAQRWGYVPARTLSNDAIQLSTEAKHLIITMCKKYATACREIENFSIEKTKRTNEEADNGRKITELTTQIEAFTDLIEKSDKNASELLGKYQACQDDLKKAKVQVKNMMKDLSDITHENSILETHLTELLRTYVPLLSKCSRLKERKINYALYHRMIESLHNEQARAIKKVLLEKAEPELSEKPTRFKIAILCVLACNKLRKFKHTADRISISGIPISPLPRSIPIPKTVLVTSNLNSLIETLKKAYDGPRSSTRLVSSYLLTCIKQKKSFSQEVQSILELLIEENLSGKVSLKQVQEKY